MPLPRDSRAYVDRLRHLFEKEQDLPQDDLAMQSHWARYLVILTSGLLEVGIKEVFSGYVGRKSAPPVAQFAERQIGYLQNPKVEKIRQLVGAFSADWASHFDAFVAGEIADSVDSVVANRHLIAHGGNVGVTLGRARQYFDDSVRLLNFLVELVET